MSRSGASRMCRVGWLAGAWECKRCTWTILLVVYPDCTDAAANQRMTLPARGGHICRTKSVLSVAAAPRSLTRIPLGARTFHV
jgi:hypothetical protein